MVDRRAFLKTVAATGALAGAGPWPALAADDSSRVALVIGNDAYPQSPLANAVNDARAVADLLRTAGFRVDLRTDTSRGALAKAVERSARLLRETRSSWVSSTTPDMAPRSTGAIIWSLWTPTSPRQRSLRLAVSISAWYWGSSRKRGTRSSW